MVLTNLGGITVLEYYLKKLLGKHKLQEFFVVVDVVVKVL